MAALGHIEQNDSRPLCLGVFSCLVGGRAPGLSHCWAAWGLAVGGGGAAEAGGEATTEAAERIWICFVVFHYLSFTSSNKSLFI